MDTNIKIIEKNGKNFALIELPAKLNLFFNDKKFSEKSPDVSNKIGDLKIAGWSNVAKTGKKYISLSLNKNIPKQNPFKEQEGEIKIEDIPF
jgi:uncharacterized protein (DUF736 family)